MCLLYRSLAKIACKRFSKCFFLWGVNVVSRVFIRVFQNAKSQNFKVGVSQNWLLYQTKSLQKELGFFLQNCGTAQFFRF